jgi:PKD domain-containing protein
VTFGAAGGSDPDGDALTCFWNFGGGSTEEQTTSLTVQHTYPVAGGFTAALRARYNRFAFSSPATVLVQPGNTPPTASIQGLGPGATFAAPAPQNLVAATNSYLEVQLRDGPQRSHGKRGAGRAPP